MAVFGNEQCCAGLTSRLHRHLHFRRTVWAWETILLIVLILMLVGVIPTWPHSKGWGYAPSGVLGLVVVILLVLVLTGRL